MDIDLDQVKNLNSEENHDEQPEISYEQLIEYVKSVLDKRVKDVRISSKLIDSPACLVLPEGAMNVRMGRLLIEQKQLNRRTTKILEINPKHKIVQTIADAIKSCTTGDRTADLVEIIFYEACLTEGEIIENPCDFVNKINKILSERL